MSNTAPGTHTAIAQSSNDAKPPLGHVTADSVTIDFNREVIVIHVPSGRR